MRTTTLRERYYEEDKLTNSNVGYPRRQFGSQDNAYTLTRNGEESGYYSDSDRRMSLRDGASRPSRLYDRGAGVDSGRTSLKDRGYEPPRSRYEHQPVAETRDDVERRQAAHSRLYDSRAKRTDEQVEDAGAEVADMRTQPIRQVRTERYEEDNQQVYEDMPYSYNSDRQESVDRHSYYRPAVVDAEPGPARNMADRYISKYADSEDLRPSTKTMQYAAIAPQEEVKVETTVSDTVSKKKPSKALSMVTVYATVFIIIAILIATVGVMISTLIKDVSGLEGQVRAEQNITASQQAQLDNYNDDGYLYSKARELGMDEGNGEKSLKLLEVKQAADVKEGNWFDKLCDLLSSI